MRCWGVWALLALLGGWALAGLPVRLGVAVRLGRPWRLTVCVGLGRGPWIACWRWRPTDRPTRPQEPPARRYRPGAAVRYLVGPPRRLQVTHLRVSLRLGTGDAASTAVLCGLAQAAFGATVAVLGGAVRLGAPWPRIHLSPDWHRAAARGHASCIVRCRFGHLMVAALRML